MTVNNIKLDILNSMNYFQLSKNSNFDTANKNEKTPSDPKVALRGPTGSPPPDRAPPENPSTRKTKEKTKI